MPTAATALANFPLTPEQRAIVEHGDGPVVVIAGAGTGKTRVIVERVRWLLETKPTSAREPARPHLQRQGRAGAARADRRAVGPATAARLSVTQLPQLLPSGPARERGRCGHAPNPDVLDGIGQLLLIRDTPAGPRPDLPPTTWNLPEFVKFINRAKDELVTPDDFDAFVDREQAHLRGPIRQLRRCGRAPPRQRQPQAGPRRSKRVRRARE